MNSQLNDDIRILLDFHEREPWFAGRGARVQRAVQCIEAHGDPVALALLVRAMRMTLNGYPGMRDALGAPLEAHFFAAAEALARLECSKAVRRAA